MKIKLVTDASSAVPLDFMQKEDIGFLESVLIIEGKDYRELTELDFEDVFSNVHKLDPYPTTSQVMPEDAVNVFQKAVDDGYDEILYLGLTPKVSSQMNVARLAAKTFKKNIKIHIYPTETTCGSQGAMTYIAWKMLKQGKNSEEIMAHLDEIKEKIYTIGVTVDIKTLFKTGKVRKGSAKGILVSLLNMKPIAHITKEDGFIGYGASLSYKSALKTMVAEIERRTDPGLEYDLYMTDTLNMKFSKKYAEAIKKARKIKEIHYWSMSAVQALSAGKGAVTATIAPLAPE